MKLLISLVLLQTGEKFMKNIVNVILILFGEEAKKTRTLFSCSTKFFRARSGKKVYLTITELQNLGKFLGSAFP